MVATDTVQENMQRVATWKRFSVEAGSMHIRVAAIVICIFFNIVLPQEVCAETVGKHAFPDTKPLSNSANLGIVKKDASCDPPALKKNFTSCLISPMATDKLRIRSDFNLVDVRSPAEYGLFRIAGSINIPLHLVKTKGFLKKQTVVLVNEGRNTSELEKICGELKQSGFERVSVLGGGLFAWNAGKRGLEGDPAGLSKLNRMPVGELFEMRASSDLTVIDVSTPTKDKRMRTWLPAMVVVVPYKSKADADSMARISSAIMQARKKSPQGRILLIADNNNVYERIDAKLRSKDLSSVMKLDGGIHTYFEHVTNQLEIRSQQNQPRRYEACRG